VRFWESRQSSSLSDVQTRADRPASGAYCSPKCRAAFSREQRVQAVAESSHLAHRELAAMFVELFRRLRRDHGSGDRV